jgi:hypothetical protein
MCPDLLKEWETFVTGNSHCGFRAGNTVASVGSQKISDPWCSEQRIGWTDADGKAQYNFT